MKRYINKDDVVTEIERKRNEYINSLMTAQVYTLNDILDFIDTLEVKENNVVEEIDYEDYIRFFEEHPEYSNGDWGFEETWAFAQYCYKLGLKAQKIE